MGENSGRTQGLRWRSWLPPLAVTLIILGALMLLGGDKPGALFHYRLF